MEATILVAVGGAVGSVGRYWVGFWMSRLTGNSFPWNTMIINVVGSFVIGALAALTSEDGRFSGDGTLRLLLMVGLCGGFTTFSSFSLQTLLLLHAGETLAALANIALSVVLCLGGTAIGVVIFTRL